jgi:hypothetical protein
MNVLYTFILNTHTYIYNFIYLSSAPDRPCSHWAMCCSDMLRKHGHEGRWENHGTIMETNDQPNVNLGIIFRQNHMMWFIESPAFRMGFTSTLNYLWQ